LLLKNKENLNEEKDELNRLEEALQVNQPLMIGYYLKEKLKLLWSQTDKKQCQIVLEDWVGQAKASGIKILVKFADTLIKHKNGIFNYYDYKISSGPMEGMNNKIKVLKRKSYGFRDNEFFKLCIFEVSRNRYPISV